MSMMPRYNACRAVEPARMCTCGSWDGAHEPFFVALEHGCAVLCVCLFCSHRCRTCAHPLPCVCVAASRLGASLLHRHSRVRTGSQLSSTCALRLLLAAPQIRSQRAGLRGHHLRDQTQAPIPETMPSIRSVPVRLRSSPVVRHSERATLLQHRSGVQGIRNPCGLWHRYTLATVCG